MNPMDKLKNMAPSMGEMPKGQPMNFVPDLAGSRVALSKEPGKLYLVNPEGVLQWIPNPATFNNLFKNWDGNKTVDIPEPPIGDPLTEGTLLVKAKDKPEVYILSNGVVRPIKDEATMEKYYFGWNKIVELPGIVIDSLPQGDIWA